MTTAGDIQASFHLPLWCPLKFLFQYSIFLMCRLDCKNRKKGMLFLKNFKAGKFNNVDV